MLIILAMPMSVILVLLVIKPLGVNLQFVSSSDNDSSDNVFFTGFGSVDKYLCFQTFAPI